MYKDNMKKTFRSNARDSRESSEIEAVLSPPGHGSWLSDSDWVITSQTPDSLFAVTPPGGEGQVWVQVTEQDRSTILQKSNSSHTTGSSQVTSPVLVETQLAIPLLAQATPHTQATSSSSSLPSPSIITPLARTLEAQIEADLVASVAELLASAASTPQALPPVAPPAPVPPVDRSSSTAFLNTELPSHANAIISATDHLETTLPTSSVLLQVSSSVQNTVLSETSPSIHLSPTLRPLSSACTPPVLGTLTATLRSALALHRSQTSTLHQAIWPTSPSVDSMTLRTGTRSMWTTPPSVDVGVQLVSGTAEMEALMACSPVDTLSSNSNNNNSSCHRNESKDKQQSSPLSGPIITDEESITVNRFDCINSGTNESHGILMNASIHNTAPTSVEPSTNASSPVSNTRHLSKHVSRRHRHQGSSSKINESMTMGQKIVRQTNSSHGTSNTKRKPFYIRYWLNNSFTVNILSVTVVSLVLFGSGFSAGSWWRSTRCHCSLAA